MSNIKSRRALKEVFVAGAYPGEEDYHDLLDSYVHKDDPIAVERVEGLGDYVSGMATACGCGQCRPQTIVLPGYRFALDQSAAEPRDTGVAPSDDGEAEADTRAAKAVATGCSITFLAPADLPERLIGVFAEGVMLRSEQQEPASDFWQARAASLAAQPNQPSGGVIDLLG